MKARATLTIILNGNETQLAVTVDAIQNVLAAVRLTDSLAIEQNDVRQEPIRRKRKALKPAASEPADAHA